MTEWVELIKTWGLASGTIVIVLWWMTQTLIPQLQKERSEAIKSFQEEMAKERELHIQVNERILDSIEKERIVFRETTLKIFEMHERALASHIRT